MINFEPTEKEAQTLVQIMNQTKKIALLYDNLLLEELLHDNDTEDFVRLENYLEEAILKEAHLYEQLNLTPERSAELTNYIIQCNKTLNAEDNNVLLAIDNQGSNKNLWKYRIINKLSEKAKEDVSGYMGSYDELKCVFGTYGANELNASIHIMHAMENDMERGFLYFLGQTIKDSQQNGVDQGYVDHMLQVKYNLSMISSSIEDEFLKTHFNFTDELYLSYFIIADYLRADRNTLDQIQQVHGNKQCILSINAMLYTDDELDDGDYNMKKTLFGCSLEASLLLIVNNQIKRDMIESVESQLDELNEETAGDFSNIKQFISDKFEQDSTNKNKCKYLSLTKITL